MLIADYKFIDTGENGFMRSPVPSSNSLKANRILWIDVAKEITIILTIIEHTLDYVH